MDIATLETVLLSLLVVDALALTVLVLLQQGKGADVGAAFGSGSSNTMFGSGGTGNFLTGLTTWLAIGFFVVAFALAYIAKERADAAGLIGIPQVQDDQVPTTGDIPGAIDELGDIPESLDGELTDAVEGVNSALESDIPSDLSDD